MKNVLLFSFTALALSVTPSPHFTAQVEAKASDEICMARKTTGRAKGEKTVTVVVKKASEASMKARGFRQASCKGNNAEHADYQKQVCKFAEIAPPEVQADFKRTYGAAPSELCQASK